MKQVLIQVLLSSFLFLGALAIWNQIVEATDSPPIRISIARIASPVESGGDLSITFAVNRTRHCHAVVARYILDPSGKTMWQEQVLGGESPLGPSTYSLVIPNLPMLPPGEYLYKTIVSSNCGDRSYIEAPDPKPFTVKAR